MELDETDDVEPAPVPDDSSIVQLRDLTAQVIYKRKQVALLEERLAIRKNELRQLEEGALPLAMQTLGVPGFDLVGGGHVGFETEVFAKLPEDEVKAEAGYAWLRSNGHGDSIKRRLSMEFPRAEDKKATALLAYARKKYPSAKLSDRDSIHWATLRKLARELLEQGEIAEGDEACKLLGVYVRRYVKVVLPGEDDRRNFREGDTNG
jgi:hypothetical protein